MLRLGLRRAMRDHGLGRNVAELADIPQGTQRKSHSMTMGQVSTVLAADLEPFWRAWMHTALMCGLRPGELAQLKWENTDLEARVLRVRGDLKTESSHRTLTMPAALVTALKTWRSEQAQQKLAAGPVYQDNGYVFADETGQRIRRERIRRGFRSACKAAGIGENWQPRETRHTFVSVLSSRGVDIEAISDAVGHINSHVTKTVYAHQIADEDQAAATAWDAITAAGAGS